MENLNKSLDDIITSQKGPKNFRRKNQSYQRKQPFPDKFENKSFEQYPKQTIYKKFIKKGQQQYNVPSNPIQTLYIITRKQKTINRKNQEGLLGFIIFHNQSIIMIQELLFQQKENYLFCKKELFEPCGQLTRLGIEWDHLGRSKGTAIVEFLNEINALKAMREYNQAELDGNILKIVFNAQL